MKQLEMLIQTYVDASIQYGEAQVLGSAKIMNKQMKTINKVREKLKLLNSLEQFVDLLDHPNDYVRLKTAISVIPIEAEKARLILKELSEKRGSLGWEAKMTLSEWEKGNLKF